MSLTVFLVEDSQPVRDVCCTILEQRGYDILVAGDVAQIREGLRHPGRIDLVLTDCELPGTDGPEVVAAARLLWPDVRVIYMTGAIFDPAMTDGEVIVTKPFTPAQLLASIDRLFPGGCA